MIVFQVLAAFNCTVFRNIHTTYYMTLFFKFFILSPYDWRSAIDQQNNLLFQTCGQFHNSTGCILPEILHVLLAWNSLVLSQWCSQCYENKAIKAQRLLSVELLHQTTSAPLLKLLQMEIIAEAYSWGTWQK